MRIMQRVPRHAIMPVITIYPPKSNSDYYLMLVSIGIMIGLGIAAALDLIPQYL
jgi:hypothetical protein